MSKTKMALNPRLRLEVFHVTVKRPSKVGQRKVRSLVRNRNRGFRIRPYSWYQMEVWIGLISLTYYVPLEGFLEFISNEISIEAICL